MQVLLLKDIKKIGKAGEIKRVADGFATNYLIPQKLVQPATKKIIEQANNKKAATQHKKQMQQSLAQKDAKKLSEVTLEFVEKANNETLFGSIGAKVISDKLKAYDVTTDENSIEIPSPIKTTGQHKVTVHLTPDVSADVAVLVKASDEN